jgi:hypothetical protein
LNPSVFRRAVAAVATGALLALSACGSDDKPAVAVAAAPQGKLITAKDFSPSRFGQNSYVVDNTWFPMKPGTQLSFEGSALDGEERVQRRTVWTITDLVKTIGGVRNAVAWERDFVNDELVEAELALFAQDKAGNVWHTGEYPEEYEEGKFIGAPAWFHGIKGAYAGITMHATPRVGTPDYQQGYAPPPLNWVDRGKVSKKNVMTCVPAGCYHALLIREFETGVPEAFQLKYYGRGVGNVRVGWEGAEDQDHEELRLVKITQLKAQGLAKARAEAMKMERHAYQVSKAVYGKTPPMTMRPGG